VSPSAAASRASERPTGDLASRATPRRPSLRVLDAQPRRRGRALRAVAAVAVVGSLLAVVVAHSMLAEGQVRLTAAQAQVAAEQSVHRQLLASVAKAENPAQIIAEAKKLDLVPPTGVIQLPAVSLSTPVGQTTTSTTSPTGR